MTNAEKFKEVFGFEINEGACCVYEDDCKECFLDRYRSKEKMLDCTEGYWQSEYQGEPTIPLSVIEKITTGIEERATYEGIYLDRADVLAIIDEAPYEYADELIRNAETLVEADKGDTE